MTSDERAVRDLVASWMAATKAGDVETILGLMTQDAVFMTAGRAPFGKAEFAAAAAALPRLQIDGTSDIRELRVIGNVAYARSYVTVSTTPPGGQPVRREGWTMSVFEKGSDGRWRLSRDANLMPPGTAA